MKNIEEFSLEEITDFSEKLMQFCKKQDVKPTLVMCSCILYAEFLKHCFHVPNKEMDQLKRLMSKIIEDGFKDTPMEIIK